MSADDFIQLVTQALYVVLFGVVAVRAARRPLRANVDVALLFGACTLVIAIGWVTTALHLTPPPMVGALSGTLLLALPYLLLRLLDDFAGVARWLRYGAAACLALCAVLLPWREETDSLTEEDSRGVLLALASWGAKVQPASSAASTSARSPHLRRPSGTRRATSWVLEPFPWAWPDRSP